MPPPEVIGLVFDRPRRCSVQSRVLRLFLLVSLLLVAVSVPPGILPANANSCAVASPAATPATPTAFPVTVTDHAGREVTLTEAPERIVSIAPSNTEILFTLGLGQRVVAVDQYSDYPPEAKEKEQLGSYVEPNIEQIVAVAPDLVLATGVHEQSVVPKLEDLRLTVAVVDPQDLEEVFDGILLVGQLTGQDGRAADLVCELQDRVETVISRVEGAERPRVFFELSPELHTAGPDSFIDDLIEHAGGVNIAADATEEWPQLSAEIAIEQDPEVILLADHEAGVTPEQVAERAGWEQVSAVKAGRIVPIDPDLTNRPGPRVVDGLEEIARALHPDLFS
jgi:iron complex transport system substrate-binding protein